MAEPFLLMGVRFILSREKYYLLGWQNIENFVPPLSDLEV